MTLPESVWQWVARIAAALMRVVPRRWRFGLALRIARRIAPIVSPMLSTRPWRYFCATPLDETFRSILRTMSRSGIEFDPRLRVEAPDDLAATIRSRGAITVSAHFPLNGFIARHLYDLGFHPAVLQGMVTGDRTLWGTAKTLEQLLPSRTILLVFRERLRARRPVSMVLDLGEADPGTRTIDTALGPMNIAVAIFQFARKLDVPLYWAVARIDESGTPFVQFRRIEPALDAFAAELRPHLDAVARVRANPAGSPPSS